jgi:hypothetical protein
MVGVIVVVAAVLLLVLDLLVGVAVAQFVVPVALPLLVQIVLARLRRCVIAPGLLRPSKMMGRALLFARLALIIK